MHRTALSVLAIMAPAIATIAIAQDAPDTLPTLVDGSPRPTFPVDLDALEYRQSPLDPRIESAVVFGDRNAPDLYTTHARVKAGARVPPHVHPNTLTTWVTSGTAYVGTGETIDEDALVAYPAGTFFVTPAGSPHFIVALDGDFSILDHGSGPSGITMIKNPNVTSDVETPG